MSANADSVEQSFSDRLTEFDSRIRSQDDNASLLNEIHESLTALMSRTGGQEDEVREVLQKRYNAGKLRLETYQLVRNVLDRVVLESMPTMPGVAGAEEQGSGNDENVFRNTTVIAGSSSQVGEVEEHLQIGSVLRDRFLLEERVAGGSMGVVYKAHDRRLAEAVGVEPWVAIKVLSPRLAKNAHALRALQQEAAKGRCLSHPNIVRFIDLDRDGDVFFIVMEWLEGRSLAAILDENRKMKVDLKTSLDIVRQVGSALDYAHRCGVVHADVKPANIMVTPTGQVKLFDFGIARIRQKEQEQETFDPGVLGALTPAYSSPQVLTGEEPVPADDVFSLACLTYRLVAGHRVFGPRNAAEAAELGLEPQRPQGLTDRQWRAMQKALARSRVIRFSSPAEFVAALGEDESAEFAADERAAGERRLPPATSLFQREGLRRYWPVAIATLVFLGILLVLAGMIKSEGRSLLDRAKALVVPGEVREAESPVAGDEKAALTDRAPREPAPDKEAVDADGEASVIRERPALDAPQDAAPAQPAETPDPGRAESDPGGMEATGQPSVAPRTSPSVQQEVPAAESTGREGDARQEATGAGSEPPDVLGFPESTIYVSESSPAVQIDVVRRNPGNDDLIVRYFVGNGTATEGEDYFLPDAFRLIFAPRQRVARLFIPLVQDSLVEPDESFSLELMTDIEDTEANISRSIEVIIRDDDG